MSKRWFLRRVTTWMSEGIKRHRGTMGTPFRRALGHVESLFIDHAVFRLAYANRHRVTPDMYRASQPSPSHVKAAADLGVKTIINLRGSRDCASFYLEDEACRRHGVALVNFPVNSRDMPKKETLHRAREIFATIEYPALLHCKSGADRAGLMAGLYLLIHEGRPVEEAARQLHWKYGHIKQAKTGILDYFFDLYRLYNERQPTPFFDWVDRVYDPVAAKESFRSKEWANTVVDRILSRE